MRPGAAEAEAGSLSPLLSTPDPREKPHPFPAFQSALLVPIARLLLRLRPLQGSALPCRGVQPAPRRGERVGAELRPPPAAPGELRHLPGPLVPPPKPSAAGRGRAEAWKKPDGEAWPGTLLAEGGLGERGTFLFCSEAPPEILPRRCPRQPRVAERREHRAARLSKVGHWRSPLTSRRKSVSHRIPAAGRKADAAPPEFSGPFFGG